MAVGGVRMGWFGILFLNRPVLYLSTLITLKGGLFMSNPMPVPARRGCQVANFKAYGSVKRLNQAFGSHWLYIGRANSYAGLDASPLANPHKRQDFGGQHGVTLPHYRRWLWEQIQAGSEAVLNSLRTITDQTVLICWCHPKPCHGEIVRAAAAWLQKQEN
jgi:hypothetical protein